MKAVWALLAIPAVVLALPVLVLLGVALGPAALGILLVLACAAPILLVGAVSGRGPR
jgi:hypothetical protein